MSAFFLLFISSAFAVIPQDPFAHYNCFGSVNANGYYNPISNWLPHSNCVAVSDATFFSFGGAFIYQPLTELPPGSWWSLSSFSDYHASRFMIRLPLLSDAVSYSQQQTYRIEFDYVSSSFKPFVQKTAPAPTVQPTASPVIPSPFPTVVPSAQPTSQPTASVCLDALGYNSPHNKINLSGMRAVFDMRTSSVHVWLNCIPGELLCPDNYLGQPLYLQIYAVGQQLIYDSVRIVTDEIHYTLDYHVDARDTFRVAVTTCNFEVPRYSPTFPSCAYACGEVTLGTVIGYYSSTDFCSPEDNSVVFVAQPSFGPNVYFPMTWDEEAPQWWTDASMVGGYVQLYDVTQAQFVSVPCMGEFGEDGTVCAFTGVDLTSDFTFYFGWNKQSFDGMTGLWNFACPDSGNSKSSDSSSGDFIISSPGTTYFPDMRYTVRQFSYNYTDLVPGRAYQQYGHMKKVVYLTVDLGRIPTAVDSYEPLFYFRLATYGDMYYNWLGLDVPDSDVHFPMATMQQFVPFNLANISGPLSPAYEGPYPECNVDGSDCGWHMYLSSLMSVYAQILSY